jgi:hypothetical protein
VDVVADEQVLVQRLALDEQGETDEVPSFFYGLGPVADVEVAETEVPGR